MEFVSVALRQGLECSISDLRTLPEFQALAALEVLGELGRVCERTGIECSPPLATGEFDDRRVFSALKSADELEGACKEALKAGEGHRVEYKQTLGLNVRRLEQQPETPAADLFSDEIIHEVIKTIVAFLNADGGVLLIGVCDDGAPYGVENEFGYLGGKADQDQWELRLSAALKAFIPDYRIITGYIRHGFVEADGCRVCVLNVEPRRDWLNVCIKSAKPGAEEIVYRRAGNQSVRLQARDIEALVMNRQR
ncbi:MAG: ATP-binding protein [Brevundimonas sp.]|nr:MAG: ATP-binding protein [Brevundimonas sp.]